MPHSRFASATPKHSGYGILFLGITALFAISACTPAAPPSAVGDPGPSGSAVSGPSPSAVARTPEATRYLGPLILFTREAPGDLLKTFTIGIDGSALTELTDAHDCCGTWSPDGALIAVPDVASSRLLPATLNADGTGYTVHTIGTPSLNLAPSHWSPDGSRTSYEAWDDADAGNTGVYISDGLPLANVVPVQITHAIQHDIALDWSPDGNRLLLIRVTNCPDGDCNGGDLYVVNADGSDLTRLSPKGTFVSCCDPASWSPDGKRVAFGGVSLDAAGKADITRSAVYVVDADGSRATPITEPGAFTEGAKWSPNGEWIAFNKKSGPVGVKGSDLYLVHPDGSGVHAITTEGAAGRSDQVGAVWSPDGTRLLFDSVPGGPVKRGDLWIVNFDGTGLTQLTNARVPVYDWSWQPGA